MQGLKVISMENLNKRVEGRAGALFAISLAIMQGSVQIEGTHHMMIITIILGVIQQQQSKEWQVQWQRKK